MKRTKLAVFASGSGSNYEAIVKACCEGLINAEVVLLVCDKPGAKVLERAARYGTESFAFNPKDYASREEYEGVIADMLDERAVVVVGNDADIDDIRVDHIGKGKIDQSY